MLFHICDWCVIYDLYSCFCFLMVCNLLKLLKKWVWMVLNGSEWSWMVDFNKIVKFYEIIMWFISLQKVTEIVSQLENSSTISQNNTIKHFLNFDLKLLIVLHFHVISIKNYMYIVWSDAPNIIWICQPQ